MQKTASHISLQKTDTKNPGAIMTEYNAANSLKKIAGYF
jgi:hypothetical protein